MYQWKEIEKTEKSGNTTRTYYEYEKIWSSSYINSSGFRKSSEFNNPREKWLLESQVFYA